MTKSGLFINLHGYFAHFNNKLFIATLCFLHKKYYALYLIQFILYVLFCSNME